MQADDICVPLEEKTIELIKPRDLESVLTASGWGSKEVRRYRTSQGAAVNE